MHPSSFGSADQGPGAAPAASRRRIQRPTAGRRLAGSPVGRTRRYRTGSVCENCIEKVPNRFHRVQRVTIRTQQARKGRPTSGRRPDQQGGRGGPAGDRGGPDYTAAASEIRSHGEFDTEAFRIRWFVPHGIEFPRKKLAPRQRGALGRSRANRPAPGTPPRLQYDAHRVRRGGEKGTVGRLAGGTSPVGRFFPAGAVDHARARTGGGGSDLVAEAPAPKEPRQWSEGS